MTQCNRELLDDIVKEGEILDRMKPHSVFLPVRNKEVLRILKEHMGLDEIAREALDKND